MTLLREQFSRRMSLHVATFIFIKQKTKIVKAEKYIITTEGVEKPARIVRMGFGIAGEEVQQFLSNGAPLVRVHVVGPEKEAIFTREKDKEWRLHDIKQRIKGLTAE